MKLITCASIQINHWNPWTFLPANLEEESRAAGMWPGPSATQWVSSPRLFVPTSEPVTLGSMRGWMLMVHSWLRCTSEQGRTKHMVKMPFFLTWLCREPWVSGSVTCEVRRRESPSHSFHRSEIWGLEQLENMLWKVRAGEGARCPDVKHCRGYLMEHVMAAASRAALAPIASHLPTLCCSQRVRGLLGHC